MTRFVVFIDKYRTLLEFLGVVGLVVTGVKIVFAAEKASKDVTALAVRVSRIEEQATQRDAILFTMALVACRKDQASFEEMGWTCDAIKEVIRGHREDRMIQ